MLLLKEKIIKTNIDRVKNIFVSKKYIWKRSPEVIKGSGISHARTVSTEILLNNNIFSEKIQSKDRVFPFIKKKLGRWT